MPSEALDSLRAQVHTRLLRLGNRVRCPCCDCSAFGFLPAGDPPRPRARCPHCGALERHRLLWPYLSELVKPGDRVLHFAPEPVIARNLAGLGIDYFPADLDADAAHLPQASRCTGPIRRAP